MAEKNGYRRARTGRGTEALTQRKADVEARKASEHIYSNLNTFTLGGDEAASASNVSLMTNAIHIQDSNQDALETANIINDALFRSDGGPIPATGKVELIQASEDGTKTPGFNPNPGEVWALSCFGVIDMAGRSGACDHAVMLFDGTNYSWVGDRDAKSSNSFALEDDAYPTCTVDENLTVVYTCTGTFTTSNLTFTAVRIR